MKLLGPLFYTSVGMSLLWLSGCHVLRHPEPYHKAQAAGVLALPPGESRRTPQDLFPIPAVTPPKNAWVSTDANPLPPPLPLNLEHDSSHVTTHGFQWIVGMTDDGNGYPVLSIGGAGFDQTWDELQNVLQMAHIPVKDLDRQLAVVYLKAKPPATSSDTKKKKKVVGSQLKLVRGVSAWQLSVEENADTLAPADFSRGILERIRQLWPEKQGQKKPSAAGKPAEDKS